MTERAELTRAQQAQFDGLPEGPAPAAYLAGLQAGKSEREQEREFEVKREQHRRALARRF